MADSRHQEGIEIGRIVIQPSLLVAVSSMLDTISTGFDEGPTAQSLSVCRLSEILARFFSKVEESSALTWKKVSE